MFTSFIKKTAIISYNNLTLLINIYLDENRLDENELDENWVYLHIYLYIRILMYTSSGPAQVTCSSLKKIKLININKYL